MAKSQGISSTIWSQEVARAIALQRHMPDVQQLQTQFVRYSGQAEAQQNDDGWLLSASCAHAASRGERATSLSRQMHHQPCDSGGECCMSTTTAPTSAPSTPQGGLPHAHHLTATTRASHASHASISPRPDTATATAAAAAAAADPFADYAEATGMSGTAARGDMFGGGRDCEGGAAAHLPQQVQLNIIGAPAEFCAPIKKDKRFRPNFQVEVRVVHQGTVHLPLRVGVFAISHDDRSRILEWLPAEFMPAGEREDSEEVVASPPKRKKTSRKADKTPLEEKLRKQGLKTHTVLSHVFQSAGTLGAASVMPTEHSRRLSDAGSSGERARPFFPSSGAPPSGPPDPGSVELANSKSLIAQADDPDLAMSMNLGNVSNTLLAQFEYQKLEFEVPSEVTPVYLVFACLVGNQDLLYTLYTVPTVSMCRRDQQAKSLAALGLPRSAMQQVDILKTPSRAHLLSLEDPAQLPTPTPTTPLPSKTPGNANPPVSTGDTMRKNPSDESPHAPQPSQGLHPLYDRTPKSDPAPRIHTEPSEQSFWVTPGPEGYAMLPNSAGRATSSTSNPAYNSTRSMAEELMRLQHPKDWHMPASVRPQPAAHNTHRWSKPPFHDNQSPTSAGMSMPHHMRPDQDFLLGDLPRQAPLSAGGGFNAPMKGLSGAPPRLSTSDASQDPLWPPSRPGLPVDDLKLPLTSLPSLGKTPSLDRWPSSSPGMHRASGQHLPGHHLPQPDMHASDTHLTHLFPFSQHMHFSAQLESDPLAAHMPMPTGGGGIGAVPGMTGHESDAMSTDGAGFSGGLSGGISGVAGIPAAPAAFPSLASTGVTQAAAFLWTHQEYCACGTLREMTRAEAQSLLLIAGFSDTKGGSGAAPAQDLPPTGSLNPQSTNTESSLLSLAGFPALAGVDKSSRISASQYAEFKAFFRKTVDSLRRVARLWNARAPSCVLAGFDVEQLNAAEALQPHPAGTFVCFFSLQANYAGHVVVACKRPPGEAGTSSAWQPQTAFLSASPDDLRTRSLEDILMEMQYATHVLDVYTGRRYDKRSQLACGPQHMLMPAPGTAQGGAQML